MPARIVFMLTFILALTGCCQQQDLTLSPAMMAWAPYQEQQLITFLGPNGQKRSFTSSISRFDRQAADQVCGAYDVETLQVQLTSVEDPAFQLQVTLSHEIVLGIKVLRQEAQALDILYNTLSQHYISDAWRDQFKKEIKLEDKTFYNVLHAYGLPQAGELSFSEMYYGRDKGLIGFKLFSGDWYYLEEKR